MAEATGQRGPSQAELASPGRPVGAGTGFLSEFWLYLRERKKFWLLPIVIVMVLFGGLIILTKGTALAPFIYTLF
jgi:Family of unknown function (DUF5989)